MVPKYELRFPNGFRMKDPKDSNIDVNIILESGEKYFATFFTVENITTIMSNQENRNSPDENYFWATDMIILKEITLENINLAISDLFKTGFFKEACSHID